MVKRLAVVAAMAVALIVLPVSADAQSGQSTRDGESDSGVPYSRVDTGSDDPYRVLDFEVAGHQLAALDAAIVEQSDADAAQLLFSSVEDLGGFQDAPVGSAQWSSFGVPLTGIAAPVVAAGESLSGASSTTSSTALGSLETAIPERENGIAGAGRTAWAFTDDAGTPAPPPDDLPPLTNPPAPPTEGIDAVPATTTTTTAPPSPSATTPAAQPEAPTTTTAPAPTTTTAPVTTTTPSTLPPTTTTTVPATTTTTTTTRPPTTTTTTTRPPTTTTTTTAPTTTTRPTTTTAPTTTTTTAPAPQQTFSLSQERPSVTACVAASGTSQGCDALWSVPLAATGDTLTFDLSLRNAGNVDAAALQVWAGSACVTTSTASPAGSGDLCEVVQLTVQRYTTPARDVPLECVYGGGTAQVCSLSTARTLKHFSTTYPSGTSPRGIGTGLQDGEAAHLRLTLRLPDVDNRFQRRTATMSLTWRQVQ